MGSEEDNLEKMFAQAASHRHIKQHSSSSIKKSKVQFSGGGGQHQQSSSQQKEYHGQWGQLQSQPSHRQQQQQQQHQQSQQHHQQQPHQQQQLSSSPPKQQRQSLISKPSIGTQLRVNAEGDIPQPDSRSGLSFDQCYDLQGELGSGAFSTVRSGKHRKQYTDKMFAIKCVDRSALTEKDEVALLEEVFILKEMKHLNIIRLYDFFVEPTTYYLVMEYMNGGELFDRIVEKEFYNEKEARDTCRVILQAICYCHDNKVAHRDLKPENLLLLSKDDDTAVKIADFGFAKKVHEPQSLTTQCGTPGYVAPEILKGVPYDTKADMWSVGVILYILLGGYPPFTGNTEQEQLRKIRKGDYEFHDDFWSPISQSAKDLISSLLTLDPTKRLSAHEALEENEWLRVEDKKLLKRDLSVNLHQLKVFNGKRKFKAAVKTIMAVNRLQALAGRLPINNKSLSQCNIGSSTKGIYDGNPVSNSDNVDVLSFIPEISASVNDNNIIYNDDEDDDDQQTDNLNTIFEQASKLSGQSIDDKIYQIGARSLTSRYHTSGATTKIKRIKGRRELLLPELMKKLALKEASAIIKGGGHHHGSGSGNKKKSSYNNKSHHHLHQHHHHDVVVNDNADTSSTSSSTNTKKTRKISNNVTKKKTDDSNNKEDDLDFIFKQAANSYSHRRFPSS